MEPTLLTLSYAQPVAIPFRRMGVAALLVTIAFLIPDLRRLITWLIPIDHTSSTFLWFSVLPALLGLMLFAVALVLFTTIPRATRAGRLLAVAGMAVGIVYLGSALARHVFAVGIEYDLFDSIGMLPFTFLEFWEVASLATSISMLVLHAMAMVAWRNLSMRGGRPVLARTSVLALGFLIVAQWVVFVAFFDGSSLRLDSDVYGALFPFWRSLHWISWGVIAVLALLPQKSAAGQ